MANWISSKLKAAETILQQIDQQAADSLRKGEKLPADDTISDSASKSGGIVPLKDQLRKKIIENRDFHGNFRGVQNSDVIADRSNEISSASKPPSNSKSTLTDSDWTELLSSPSPSSTSASNHNNGVSSIRGVRRDGRKPVSASYNKSAFDVKRNQKSTNGVYKSPQELSVGETNKSNAKLGNEEHVSSSGSSGAELEKNKIDKNSVGPKLDKKGTDTFTGIEPTNTGNQDRNVESKDLCPEDSSRTFSENHHLKTMPVMGKVASYSDVNMGVDGVRKQLGSAVEGNQKSNVLSGSSVSDGLRKSSSTSYENTSSDTDSGSSSDSENEREREERRKRREKILAEKVAAKAAAVIKERENLVARMEGEKDSLEKILEERARQQALEASVLQTTMMETMDAVDLEKQKHNITRKEALARLTKLETANADLARSLAAVQGNLEVEANRVVGLRQQIELKEATCDELKRRISSSQQTGTSLKNGAALRGAEFERQLLAEEYSLINDKVLQMEGRAKNLEENIAMTRKEIEEPTEVEAELKRRLSQMTDHLIQKQAKVEALSSEKGTLVFRIEAAAKQVEENKMLLNVDEASLRDLESDSWEVEGKKLRPFEKKIDLGKRHLGSWLHQLDALYVAGAVFLRRNSTARSCSIVYLFCLHFWVLYILFSHSQPANESKSGAVISLENINSS